MAIKNRSYGVCKFGLLPKEKFLDPSPMKYISCIVLYQYLFLSFLSLFLAIPSILTIIIVVVVVVVVEWFSCYRS